MDPVRQLDKLATQLEALRLSELARSLDSVASKLAVQFSDIVVFRETDKGPEVLLSKRAAPPAKGEWACPGGHVDPGESFKDAAIRELKEETGITSPLHYLETKEIGTRAKDEDESKVAIYYTVVGEDVKPKPASDSLALKWVEVSSLQPLAFDHHEEVFKAADKAFGHDVIKQARQKFASLETPLKKYLSTAWVKTAQVPGGLLIALEGIDGAGKTTQTELLKKWMESHHHEVVVTKWNSSELLADAIKEAKEKRLLSPMLFCLLHAADFFFRYENVILPALHANKIVICDRYFFTSYARDVLRGISPKLLNDLYTKVRRPDILIHCTLPVKEAVNRCLENKGISHYSAGMDLDYSKDKAESAYIYEKKMNDIYNLILPLQANYVKLNVSRPIEEVAKDITEFFDHIPLLANSDEASS